MGIVDIFVYINYFQYVISDSKRAEVRFQFCFLEMPRIESIDQPLMDW